MILEQNQGLNSALAPFPWDCLCASHLSRAFSLGLVTVLGTFKEHGTSNIGLIAQISKDSLAIYLRSPDK